MKCHIGVRQFSKRCVLSFNMVVAAVLVAGMSACQQVSFQETPQQQTVGQLVERNGQHPARLGISLKRKIYKNEVSELVSLENALSHYDHILSINAAPELRAESLRRAADLRLEAVYRGLLDEQILVQAKSLYIQLLNSFPDYPDRVQVYYQQARLEAFMNNDEGAISNLEKIPLQHPSSKLADKAQFRAAEMLLQSGEFSKAADAYQKVISLNEHGDYVRFARYKNAWAKYKLGDYRSALSGIKLLLDEYYNQFDLIAKRRNGKGIGQSNNMDGIFNDALRLAVLSLSAADQQELDRFLPPGEKIGRALEIYKNLIAYLLDNERFADAADIALHFSVSRADSEAAPGFHRKAIAAYLQGGLDNMAFVQRQAFVERYDPGDEVMKPDRLAEGVELGELKSDILMIARVYNQQGKAELEREDVNVSSTLNKAIQWYRRWLARFPDDKQWPDVQYQLGDVLYDSENYNLAAEEYARLAYSNLNSSRRDEAALAAIKSQLKHVETLISTEAQLALESTVIASPNVTSPVYKAVQVLKDLSMEFAEKFPDHKQAPVVILQVADILFKQSLYSKAHQILNHASLHHGKLSVEQNQQKLLLSAETLYFLDRYAEAETLYEKLIKQSLYNDAESRMKLRERLANAKYHRADDLQASGDLNLAADLLDSVLLLSHDRSVLERAMLDAATLRFRLGQWLSSVTLLERYRQRFPAAKQLFKVDKMLGKAYLESGQRVAAAEAYQRLSGYENLAVTTRRQANLKAAELFRDVGRLDAALVLYEQFLKRFNGDVDQDQEIRWQIAEIYSSQESDGKQRRKYLNNILKIDNENKKLSERSRYIAASASLFIAKRNSDLSHKIVLSAPFSKNIERKKQFTELAVEELKRAISYGFVEVSTAALNELGNLYASFGKAILNSERPDNLSAQVLAEYQLLLEEQAYPFEEKAISVYENNLDYVREGIWNNDLRESLSALVNLVPGKYAKQLRLAGSYDALR